MRNWKNTNSSPRKVLLDVELNFISELDLLSYEKLTVLEQAIVASVEELLTSTIRKRVKSECKSTLTTYSPCFRTESRYTIQQIGRAHV